MAKELNVQQLDEAGRDLCEHTIGPNTFFMLVANALAHRTPLSVVRMGDGEKGLYQICQDQSKQGEAHYEQGRLTGCPWGDDWLDQMGVRNIPIAALANRIVMAANNCTYFAPQIMGIQRSEFALHHLFRLREFYVDNWFVREWSHKMQDQLLTAAGKVLFIHGRPDVSVAFHNRCQDLQIQVEIISMRTWADAGRAIAEGVTSDAPLVLFSGGPANKFIAPEICKHRSAVVLDLGQAAEKEWL